jgi:hypothetical protein
MEGMNILEEHDHLSNHQPGEEGMDMVDIHMMEVEGMDMVEGRPLNQQLEDESMDMVVERLSKEWPEV